jgi:hypothetical protein
MILGFGFGGRKRARGPSVRLIRLRLMSAEMVWTGSPLISLSVDHHEMALPNRSSWSFVVVWWYERASCVTRRV